MRVMGVAAGRTGVIHAGKRAVRTAFVKQAIEGRVEVGLLGLPGDEHVYSDHGGPDMALLVYSFEHYAAWRAEGLELPDAAAMGENLTIEGLTELDAHIGDVLAIGTTVVQICQPRSPCSKIAARYGRKDLPVRVQDTGRTGYLLRVLEPGELGVGDDVELRFRDDHGITVHEAGQLLNVARNDLDGARRLLALETLGSSARRKLQARVDAAADLGLDVDRLFLPDVTTDDVTTY